MKSRVKFLGIIIIALINVVSVIGCNSSTRNSVSNSDTSEPQQQVSYYISRNAPSSPASFNDITASQLVAGMNIGWNLGNTLDVYNGFPANPNIYQFETAWGNPITTKANIDAIKNAGFNTIRIPVSWAKASNSNYIIRSDWMDRVTEVVNYAVSNDMYIILNTHHDEDIFKFTNSAKAESLKAFRIIWGQIAENFKNYNEKLIFEGLNEPRTKGSANEWTGGLPSEHNIINEYYQLFVDVVRASGGNNGRRILMINPYAASAEQTAINGLRLPRDTVANKLIVSIHAYSPYNFALNQGGGATSSWSPANSSDTSAIRSPLDRAYNTYVSKGIPVVMGEFGAVDRNNTEARAQWAEYYVSYAKSKGIPCVLWDNGLFRGQGERFGFLDRRENTFPFPTILEAFMRGVE